MNIFDIFKKDIKTISLSFGGFYIFIGGLALLMIEVIMPNFAPTSEEIFLKSIDILSDIWIIYMPLLIIIGISYLAFGFFSHKIKTSRFQINLLLSLLSLFWVISYMISNLRYLETFLTGFSDSGMINIAYIFAGIGFLTVLALLTIPQYVIAKKIRKQDKEMK
jgi:hypothetical protein